MKFNLNFIAIRLSLEQPAGPEKSCFYPMLAKTWKYHHSGVDGHLQGLTQLSRVWLFKLFTETPVSFEAAFYGKIPWLGFAELPCQEDLILLSFLCTLIFSQLFLRIHSCNSLFPASCDFCGVSFSSVCCPVW